MMHLSMDDEVQIEGEWWQWKIMKTKIYRMDGG